VCSVRRVVDHTHTQISPVLAGHGDDVASSMHPDELPPTSAHIDPAHETKPELLHICSSCGGELVYPLDWIEEEETHWRMLLRCPDCESTREGIFAQQTIDVFADELDRGEAELLSTLKQVTREHMSEAVDRFIRALYADLILPSDF
jgi:DNA-directed RNA polymerase subunit RPC12/RpoP